MRRLARFLFYICKTANYCVILPALWSHRLAVRTPDSHSGNTGSIPVGTAIIFIFSKNKNCADVLGKRTRDKGFEPQAKGGRQYAGYVQRT